MNNYTRYIVIILILFAFGNLYESYKQTQNKKEKMDQYDLIKKYLLNESSLAKSKKPILWIHINLEKNARWWSHFYSRNSECLNQPYQYLTIKSIVDKCGESFNICLIDDKAFNKIIPGWSNQIANLPNPLRPHLRQLAMAKLLYYYGGMTIPSSTICFSDLKPIYNNGLNASCMFVAENKSEGDTSTYTNFFPCDFVMGCEKGCDEMKCYINYLEGLVSTDYTAEMDFNAQPDRWLYKEFLSKKINVLNGLYFGVKNKDNKAILLDDLLAEEDIELSKKTVALCIPQNELLKRTYLNWFVRMSPEQVLESNTMIGKYLLLSN
jgi:hypothetical protein